MILQEIHVDGVRNLRDVTLRPHPRLTVLVGANGQGKTNLLEAIHLAAALRPLRTLERASDLVGFGKEQGLIHARFDIDGPLDVVINVEPRGRKATIGGKAVRDVAILSERLSVVSFVPDDASMIRGAPGDRRRGLDRFAFALFPQFAAASRRFEEALEQRNRLLKDVVVDDDALDAFTPPFISAAADLTRLRAEACARWAPVFAAEAHVLGGDALAATLHYHAGLVDDDVDVINRSAADLAAHLEDRLRRSRDIEKRKRQTLCGPQHDDVVFMKLGKKARFLASQGEARGLVLALKLASVRLLTQQRGQGPLLLLDDVAGELDKVRAARLLDSIDEHGAQTFVTTTDTQTLPPLGESLVIAVVGGRTSTQ